MANRSLSGRSLAYEGVIVGSECRASRWTVAISTHWANSDAMNVFRQLWKHRMPWAMRTGTFERRGY